MTFDPSTLNEAVQEAPEAGFAALNYGRLTVEANVVSWEGEKGSRTKVERPLKKGEKIGPNDTLELAITVDLQELNPALEFNYTRNVPVRKSSPRAKTDWSEIVEPSLLAVFGEKWATVVGRSPYVCVEDVPNVAGKASKTSGKVFGVPKFIAAYKSLEDCVAAHDKQFGSRGGGTNGTGNGEIPAGVIASARTLAQAVTDETQLRQLLGMEPYKSYDTDDLLEKIRA